jgi:hypothetical protein
MKATCWRRLECPGLEQLYGVNLVDVVNGLFSIVLPGMYVGRGHTHLPSWHGVGDSDLPTSSVSLLFLPGIPTWPLGFQYWVQP